MGYGQYTENGYDYRRHPAPVTRVKGVKQVFKTDMVAHVWAQQSQAYGRNSQGNIYFEGPSIYSYGSHFEMARFVKAEVVLMTTRSYSVTTRGHLNAVEAAVKHKTLFQVPSFHNHKENFEYLIQETIDAYQVVLKATHPHSSEYGSDLQTAEQALATAARYQEIFKLKPSAAKRAVWTSLSEHTYISEEEVVAWRERAATWAIERARRDQVRSEKQRVKWANREAEQKARYEKQQAESEENWQAWLRGEAVNGHLGYGRPMALRVFNGMVETSQGAEVTVREARKLYRALKAGVNVVEMRVGHFTVNKLDTVNITIGCHTIPLSEIERIAPMVLEAVEHEPVCQDCGQVEHAENCYQQTQATG